MKLPGGWIPWTVGVVVVVLLVIAYMRRRRRVAALEQRSRELTTPQVTRPTIDQGGVTDEPIHTKSPATADALRTQVSEAGVGFRNHLRELAA